MMKTVILAGGRGSRLGRASDLRPKPMAEIGGVPIIVHIMKIYASHGFTDFVIALGYLAAVVKRFFLDYRLQAPDITVDLAEGATAVLSRASEDWTVRLVDTGLDSMTGGRLHRLRPILEPQGTFMVTYGDGVADVDIESLVEFHRSHGRLATVTAVRPPARFGALRFNGGRIVDFQEKPQVGEGWINGGFFVFEPGVFEYLENDATVLEETTLEALARDGELMGYMHDGYWQCMDTPRDLDELNVRWHGGNAPWKSSP